MARSAPRVLVVRTPFVRVLLEHVRARGGDAEGLARRFAIPPGVLAQGPASPEEEPECAITAIQELTHAAAEHLNDAFLGVHLAASVKRGSYGVIDFAVASAPTVGEALQRLIRYQRLVNTAVSFSVERRGADTLLEHRIPGAPQALGRHGNEYTLTTVVRRCHELCRKAIWPARAWFAHPAPADVSELVAALGTETLQFEAGTNGLMFGPGFYDQPIPAADPALLRVLDTYAASLVSSTPEPTDFRARVEHHIRLRLQDGTALAERIAPALSMSVRTLHRRLGELGTTFQEILDDVRHRQALVHMGDPMLTVGEVAFLLGYSEPSAFVRAFKRWTNTTPQQHRLRAVASRTTN
jgi:AraC-like DNA-binding protein